MQKQNQKRRNGSEVYNSQKIKSNWKSLKRVGKSNHRKDILVWAKELKEYLIDTLKIDWCELCGSTYWLQIAHSKKRRFITDRDTYFEAAILCQKCHTALDEATGDDVHERMHKTITAIISRRAS